MARQKLKSLITSFTSDGHFLAVLSPNGVVKIWSTNDGSLLAEWKQPDGDPVVSYSCMACSFIRKKVASKPWKSPLGSHRKERGTLLVALGTNDGDILAVDVSTGEQKWKSTGNLPGGLAGLAFANKSRSLHVVGTNGMASEMKSETGEVIREFKASKKPISSSTFLCEGNLFALANSEVRVLSLENWEELLKFSDDVCPIQYISVSDGAKTIITSGHGEKHLQVWRCDVSSKTVNKGPVIFMRHSPIAIECKSSSNGKDGTVVLAVAESGVAYAWYLKTVSQDEELNPTKITVKVNKADVDQENSANVKKSRTSIIAARLNDLEADGRLTAIISYGSIDALQFSLVDISNPGENIVISAGDASESVRENGIPSGKGLHDSETEAATASAQNKKRSKRRAVSDPDLATTRDGVDTGNDEDMDGVLVDNGQNEPTMGEKLATLNLHDNSTSKSHEEIPESSPTKPPSADSVNVLLKQALHVDDRVLLLDCLYNQDKKVIANSISLLKPSDVLKLLHSLVSIIQSRGAVLACALPWLKSLLLQHASGIMSQESSLSALNTLYQLIESRVSTFQSAVQISSCLDFHFSGIVNDGVEEHDAITPLIYEDKDSSEEEDGEGGSEDAMETDQENEEEENEDDIVDGISDFEGIDAMSD